MEATQVDDAIAVADAAVADAAAGTAATRTAAGGTAAAGTATEAGDTRNFDDLPPIDTTRWVARRKAEILTAIGAGRLTRAEACARYNISEAELRLWERAVACAGVPGLRVTRVQIYRPVFEARGGQ